MKHAILLTAALALLAFACEPSWSQSIVVSEILASNRATLADNHDEYTDWIELFNPGDTAVSLDGWFLTDSPADLTRWRFPDVELGRREYLIVFCSAKDRADPAEGLHTNFELSGDGEYLGLISPQGEVAWQIAPFYPPQRTDVSFGSPQDAIESTLLASGASAAAWVPVDGSLALDWTEPTFNDSGWVTGATGIGFDRKPSPTYAELIVTDIGDLMRFNSASAYVRVRFAIDNLDAVDLLSLLMKYDDGFVAYLNGTEVASSRAPDDLQWDSRAASTQSIDSALEFEEFDLTGYRNLLVQGENVLAIHGLNSSAGNSAFFVLPELVTVSVGDVDAVRKQFFSVPTPGAPNAGGFDRVSQEPTFSPTSGAHVGNVEVTISVPAGEGSIRYSLDGSTPDEESLVYSSPILLDRTTQIKARVFETGLLPSAVVAETFLVISSDLEDFSSNLPVVVIDTFGQRLVRTEAPLDLEPCHVHVVNRSEDGRSSIVDVPDFSGRGGVKVRGSSTARREKASLTFEIWDAEDDDRAVPLLGMPADSDWVLYGPFFPDRALIRNAFAYELANQIGRYAVRTQFVELFLNEGGGAVRGPVPTGADYFGVYVFTEKITRGPHRVDVEPMTRADNEEPAISGGYMFKIDRPDPFDKGFFVNGQPFRFVEPKEDDITPQQADWLQNYVKGFLDGLTGPDFGYRDFIDVYTFIDHHILNEFPKNPDAFSFSTYLHKRRNGKLRMGPIWDFNLSMGVDRAVDPQEWSLVRSVVWWGELFADPPFARQYVERWHDLRRNEFTLVNLHATIDGMALELSEAQARNFRRWSDLGVGPGVWQGEINALKQWYTRRVAWMDCELRLPPDLDPPGGFAVFSFPLEISNANDVGEVLFTLNGPDPMLPDGGISPEAQTAAGPVAITENTRVRARVRIDECLTTGNAWTEMTEAVFYESLPSLVISEIMYEPAESSRLEYVEIFNFGDEPVSLQGVSVAEGIDFEFDQGGVASLGPREYVVVVRDLEEFAGKYDVSEIQIAGEYSGLLRDRGEAVALVGAVGEPIFRMAFVDTWYPEASGGGHSLVLVDVGVPADMRDDPSSWQPSVEPDGSPGRVDRKASGGQLPGDINQDGRFNISDALALVVHLFRGGATLPCDRGESNRMLLDSNADMLVDGTDVVHTLGYLFLDGPPPVLGLDCIEIASCPEVCAP